MNANKLTAALVFALAAPLAAQQSLESSFRTTGTAVVAAFEEQRQALQQSSAVVLDGRDEIAYGVVISPDGYLLTKASEISAAKELGVTVDRTHYKDVKIVEVDPTWDVALLKVDAAGWVPVTFAPTSAVPHGTWVVANGATTRTTRRLLAGIISAKSREISAAGGAALGIILNPKAELLEIDKVSEKSGAKEAGLQKGDVILSVEGKKTEKIEDIAEVLKDRKDGSMVKLTYRRNGEEKTADVRLMARDEMAGQMNRNDQMSGNFSERRSGFPRVIQHDILGSNQEQGGPLLDLEGRCLGMNIARANRAENFTIPVENLKEIAERLMKRAAGN